MFIHSYPSSASQYNQWLILQPKTGFPTHPHREAEIFSYILSGELSHKDSMGNVETMKRGDVQMTSGGTGIKHSEYNDHAT